MSKQNVITRGDAPACPRTWYKVTRQPSTWVQMEYLARSENTIFQYLHSECFNLHTLEEKQSFNKSIVIRYHQISKL